MTAAADAQSAEKKHTEQNIKNTQVFNLKEGQTNEWMVCRLFAKTRVYMVGFIVQT